MFGARAKFFLESEPPPCAQLRAGRPFSGVGVDIKVKPREPSGSEIGLHVLLRLPDVAAK